MENLQRECEYDLTVLYGSAKTNFYFSARDEGERYLLNVTLRYIPVINLLLHFQFPFHFLYIHYKNSEHVRVCSFERENLIWEFDTSLGEN